MYKTPYFLLFVCFIVYEASAATGEGVQVMFDEMLNNVLQKRKASGLLPKLDES